MKHNPALLKAEYMTAMRADSIPAAWSNLWFVHKCRVDREGIAERHGKSVYLPAGEYTYLRYLTDGTLYMQQMGEIIMEDTAFELQTHLGFVMQAHGNVLIGGLGLGCVIRGLLKNPDVTHVTCIENSPDVLKLVAPYMPTERLTIVEADMLVWAKKNKATFDCGWYDLWTNQEKGEPHLDIWHAKLFNLCKRYVKRQGAWAFRREAKNLLIRKGVDWIG